MDKDFKKYLENKHVRMDNQTKKLVKIVSTSRNAEAIEYFLQNAPGCCGDQIHSLWKQYARELGIIN